ncbi:unnamed protein product [Natator depressus]
MPPFSILLHQSSMHKFAFMYESRQLTFTRVPQGLHNAPSICHHFVSAMWTSVRNQCSTLSYVDDILIATPNREENLDALEEVLGKIQEIGFTVNPAKAQMALDTIALVPKGQRPDQQHVELICKHDVLALWSFLGLAGFSREFDKYAEIAKPLYQLLRKGQEWQWEESHQQAFTMLK